MKSVPKGAIATHADLKVIGGALSIACQDIRRDIDRERSAVPRTMKVSEVPALVALKASLREYSNLLNEVDRIERRHAKVGKR